MARKSPGKSAPRRKGRKTGAATRGKGRRSAGAVVRRKKAASARRKRPGKARPPSLGGKIQAAVTTVLDTIRDTRALRDRLEPPGQSETE